MPASWISVSFVLGFPSMFSHSFEFVYRLLSSISRMKPMASCKHRLPSRASISRTNILILMVQPSHSLPESCGFRVCVFEAMLASRKGKSFPKFRGVEELRSTSPPFQFQTSTLAPLSTQHKSYYPFSTLQATINHIQNIMAGPRGLIKSAKKITSRKTSLTDPAGGENAATSSSSQENGSSAGHENGLNGLNGLPGQTDGADAGNEGVLVPDQSSDDNTEPSPTASSVPGNWSENEYALPPSEAMAKR